MFRYTDTSSNLPPNSPEDSTPPTLCTVTALEMNCELAAASECEVKVYKRRFWMLIIYGLLMFLHAIMIPQYVTMIDVNVCYYGVTQAAVYWTAQTYMLVYIVIVIPTSLLMSYIGLRWSLICGSALNTTACILQFFTVKQEGFVLVIISCVVGGLASPFVLGMSPFLAARWFPSHELSRACSFGIFGNQIGVAIGLIFSPLMVGKDCSMTDAIEIGKRNVAYIVTTANACVFFLILLTFQNSPFLPPSIEQRETKIEKGPVNNVKYILGMMMNLQFVLIFLLSGLMVGSFLAFLVTANDLMIGFFPDKEVEIGWMIFFSVLMSIIGSIVAGFILDFTQKFKETAISYCTIGLLFYILFSSLLPVKTIWVQFLTSGILGFFVAGCLPIVLEYGIEITFPASEMLSSNLLYFSIQVFGIAITQFAAYLLKTYGSIALCATLGTILLLSSIITGFLTKNYKRSKSDSGDNLSYII